MYVFDYLNLLSVLFLFRLVSNIYVFDNSFEMQSAVNQRTQIGARFVSRPLSQDPAGVNDKMTLNECQSKKLRVPALMKLRYESGESIEKQGKLS